MMKSCRMFAMVVPSFFISSVSSSASGVPAPRRLPFPDLRAETEDVATTPPFAFPLLRFAASACSFKMPGIQSSATPGK
jgi:hypothetical protein